ncbi:MAG: acyl-CoA thioesterase [Bryobacter sp.]|nr:acyl-CoA thioesterase [Bryobacter sp.]
MQEPRAVRESRSEISELALPNDANPLGNLIGGRVMHLVDIAGAIAASRHARAPVVTASVDYMNFLNPIHIGQLVRVYSSVNRAWNTSMEVGVKVCVEDLMTGEVKHTTSAYLTFVAVDGKGAKVKVPAVLAETETEKRRYEQAGERRKARLEMKARLGSESGA